MLSSLLDPITAVAIAAALLAWTGWRSSAASPVPVRARTQRRR